MAPTARMILQKVGSLPESKDFFGDKSILPYTDDFLQTMLLKKTTDAPFTAEASKKDSSGIRKCKAGLLACPVRNAFPVINQWLRNCCGTHRDLQQRELLPIHTAFPFNRAGRERPLRTIAMQS